MALARKIAYNVVIVSVLKVASTVLLSLFSIKLITGYLGQEGFGQYATVLAFFAFFSAIADLGIGMITVREISRPQADEKRILGNVLSLRLLSSGGIFLLSPFLIFFFGYPAELKEGILIAAFAIIFSTMSLVLNGIFQKRVAMQEVAMIEFIGKILQVAFIAFAVAKDWGFLSIVSAILVSMSFNAVSVFLMSRRHIRFPLRFERAYWKEFLRESYPLGVTAIITFLYFKFDTIILSVLRPATDVGIYNVAYKIMENLIFFPAMLAGLIIPLLSKHLLSNRKKFDMIASKTFKVFLIIVLPIAVGTLFLAEDIILIVSGPSFLASAEVLRVLVVSLFFIFFGHFFNMILLVSNAQKKLMWTLSFAALFNIALNLFLIPRFSYMGAAFASASTEAFVVLTASFIAFRHIGYRPSFQGVPPLIIASFGMAIFLFLLHGKLPFLLLGLGAVILYGVLLWLCNGVTKEEMDIILSGRRLARESQSAEHTETIV
ncbi:MAG: flippase [Candidatus Moraniibacteriota bacterium]